MKSQRSVTGTGQSRSLRTVGVLAMALLVVNAAGCKAKPVPQDKPLQDKPMTTARPAESLVVPLFNSMFHLDQAEEANGGKAPTDALARIEAIQALADKAKPEYSRFAIALKSAGEIESFNNFIAGRAKEIGSASLIAELQTSDGNAYEILLKAGSVVQSAIDDRRDELGLARTAGFRLDRFLGVATLEAGFWRKAISGVCSAVVFTVSLGYGTDFNYHGCGLS